jgi:signal transduction histidine kinase
VPLVARDRVVGVMNVASADAREFTPEEIALLDSVGRQIGVAVENARLWEEVKEKEVLRSQFLEKIIAAQEAERKRLARELHDEASQTLTALSLGLRTLQESKDLTANESQLVENLKSLTTGLMSELHRLALQLRPSALDRVGLVGALEQYVREVHHHYALDIQFETEKMDGAVLSPEIEISLYRIVQEALTNVARHAQATHAAVLVQVRDGNVVATVEDDGKGFDPDDAAKKGRLGLFGMQERAALLNGSVIIESAEGAGTTIFIQIPIFTDEKREIEAGNG